MFKKNIVSFVRIPNDRPSKDELVNYCLEHSEDAEVIVLTGSEYTEITSLNRIERTTVYIIIF